MSASALPALPSSLPVPPTPPLPPALLEAFGGIIRDWRRVFPQSRSFLRAAGQALGGLLALGRRTMTRIIWTNGGEQRPWAAEYHLHSRCQWDPQALFAPIWKQALEFCPGRVVGVALDDTRLHKTGRCIQAAFYQRDPLSPPFHLNLMLGLRFLQASLLVPMHRESARFGARGLPVRFEEVSRVKRPGRTAGKAAMAAWKQASAKHNLSQHAVGTMRALRASLDAAGGEKKTLVVAGDASFCNRTCFGTVIERTELLVRARKDAVLCRRAEGEGRRFYGKEKFTPEAIRKDEAVDWRTTRLNYGGKRRKVRYKEVTEVYWQGGARKRPLPGHRDRAHAVSQTPERAALLPAGGVFADQRLEDGGEQVNPDLPGPVADRSQSPGGKGHAGRGAGAVMERSLGAQTTRAGGGGLQRAASGRAQDLWSGAGRRLRGVAEMAAPGAASLVSGPGGVVAPGSRAEPAKSHPFQHSKLRLTLPRRCRRLIHKM